MLCFGNETKRRRLQYWESRFSVSRIIAYLSRYTSISRIKRVEVQQS